MDDQHEPNPAIEAAIAAQAAPRAGRLDVQLAGGRSAQVLFPIPISPEDVLRITAAFSSWFLQNFDAEQKATANGRIIVPT